MGADGAVAQGIEHKLRSAAVSVTVALPRLDRVRALDRVVARGCEDGAKDRALRWAARSRVGVKACPCEHGGLGLANRHTPDLRAVHLY
jgi:hypothetical protein